MEALSQYSGYGMVPFLALADDIALHNELAASMERFKASSR